MKRRVVICLVMLIATLTTTNANAAYKGRVVDDDTKEPVKGVVVFMAWYQTHFMSGSTFLDAYETVTDEQGQFSLPRYWSINPWKMMWADNLLTIFKSGYEPVAGGSWMALMKYEWGETMKGKIILKLEHGKPVILLRKAGSNFEKRSFNLGRVPAGGYAPKEMKLLNEEIRKEEEILWKCKGNRQC